MIENAVFAGIGLFLFLTGYPLARGRVKRNPTYGLRTGETLADDEVWEVANRRAGRELMVLGLSVVIWSAVTWRWPVTKDETLAVLLTTGMLVVGAIVVATRGYIHGIRLTSERKSKGTVSGSNTQ